MTRKQIIEILKEMKVEILQTVVCAHPDPDSITGKYATLLSLKSVDEDEIDLKWILDQMYAMRSSLKDVLRKDWMDENQIKFNHEKQLQITKVIRLIESSPQEPTQEWISIEDDLPKMLAKDLLTGGTRYLVVNKEGDIDITIVSDHNVWYHLAKEAGVTHYRPLPNPPKTEK